MFLIMIEYMYPLSQGGTSHFWCLGIKIKFILNNLIQGGVMDTNLISGLIGAIIGSIIAGLFSFWGATRSTKTTIKAQKELLKEEFDRSNIEMINKRKKYSSFIESEIVMWIDYSVHRINKVISSNEKRAQNLDFNNNYRLYLDTFIDKLTVDESILIMELYGLIKKININLEKQSYVSGDTNELIHSIELLILKAFTKEFLDEYKVKDPSLITRDSILLRLNKEAKFLIIKLNELSDNTICVN